MDVLVPAGAELGEGPVWSEFHDCVIWVDINAGRVHATTLDGQDETIAQVDEPIGAVALTAKGAIVGATPTGLRALPGRHIVARLPGDQQGLRMNDGKADPFGRFVGGTMGVPDPTPGAGTLWSFESGSARALLPGVTISNGLCWSDDGRTLYYIDTPTQRVDAFDYDLDTGSISRRHTVIEIDPADGAPDGMTIDAEGGLWIALWGGSSVRRYVDDRLDHVVRLPTPFVTCPTFVGPRLDHLVVTTAAGPFGATRPMGAGDVYITRPGVAGHPPHLLDDAADGPDHR